ncbi:MAG: 4Fe-4S binding protein [Oligoflexia bacterium]|nr:4Fe-4S binding protein [Oligoflexia bacterium]
MKSSIFSTVRAYLYDVYLRFRSIWGSLLTALPYLWGAGELRKEVTEQYPDPISSRTADDLPARSRGLLFNDIQRCTGCKECEKICPVQCIRVDTEAGSDPTKLWVARFDIDFSKCVFCGLCVESCHPQSLMHSRQYEGAVYELKDLVASFGRGYVTAEQRMKWAALRKQAESDEVYL